MAIAITSQCSNLILNLNCCGAPASIFRCSIPAAAAWLGLSALKPDKYEVSVKIGERVLLPAVRNAAADTLIITDGFSCYQQIEGLTGRRALHMAEVLQMAIRGPR